jgi:Wiskott-Aldrich syndrome protein
VAPPTALPPPGFGAPGVAGPPPVSTLPAPAPEDDEAFRLPPPEATPAAEAAAGLPGLAAEPEAAAAGVAEPDPPDETPALPPEEAAAGAPAEAPADPDSPGAAAEPESPEEYPPPGAAAPPPPPWAETFWLWALRAARWAALPPQAAGIINPAVSTTKRRREAMQLPP